MKQQNYLIFTLLFLVGILFSSCNKEVSNDITLDKWKVIKLKQEGDTDFTLAKQDYILEFLTDTTYTINLDINSCTGKYSLINESGIELVFPLCSYACCDSQIAVDIIKTLPKMNSYIIQDDELNLEGNGKIILEKL